MKKNLITVIILALVLVNLVLTAVLTITIVPETQKANELITKVCNAIDLDLQAGDTAGNLSVKIADLATYDIPEEFKINLADDHIAVITVTIQMDSKHEDFATYGSGNLATWNNLLRGEISNIIKTHTMDEMKNNTAAVQAEIVEDLQSMFGSTFIIGVGFSSALYQ